MAKSWSKAKPRRLGQYPLGGGQNIVAALFLIVLALFLLLPRLAPALVTLWGDVSLSRLSVDSALHNTDRRSLSPTECRVIAVSPQPHYDSLLLVCDRAHPPAVGAKIFLETAGQRSWLGSIVSTQGHYSLATAISDPSQAAMNVSVTDVSERISISPIGGGGWVAELPASMHIPTGAIVTDTDTTYVIGAVSGVSVDTASSLQRVYIHIPLSFESITVVSLGQ